jgi:hypothetical protein
MKFIYVARERGKCEMQHAGRNNRRRIIGGSKHQTVEKPLFCGKYALFAVRKGFDRSLRRPTHVLSYSLYRITVSNNLWRLFKELQEPFSSVSFETQPLPRPKWKPPVKREHLLLGRIYSAGTIAYEWQVITSSPLISLPRLEGGIACETWAPSPGLAIGMSVVGP